MVFLSVTTVPAQPGATVPWTTYEAENGAYTGALLGPGYSPNTVEGESSGRECVRLSATGQYVQFTAQVAANALVVRYSVPDTADGTGTNYTLSLYTNGTFAGEIPVTSKYSWLYGSYPWTNWPAAGSPRNFYDEARLSGLTINPGDTIKLSKGPSDTATNYDIDLIDLEEVSPPLAQPANSLAITNYGADPTGANDSTIALWTTITAADGANKTVWIPPGNYKITNQITLFDNTTVQGAGMWYSSFVGDPILYAGTNVWARVIIWGQGTNIHLADFAVQGKLNNRNGTGETDGIAGSYGTGSTISRLWVEHTGVGVWIENSSGLVIDGCRFRNTIADGCNLNIGIQQTTVTNCATRGTGDDCFAIWPTTYAPQTLEPGYNTITHCTAQVPFTANGASIYGATNNTIEDCFFQDTTYGCGVLISSEFPIATNNFGGTTIVRDCNINRCGGFDTTGIGWRAGVQVYTQLTNISGLYFNNLNISNSIADGFDIVSFNPGTWISNAVMSNVNVPNFGIGIGGRHALWAESNTVGSLTVSNCNLADYLDSSPTFAFTFLPTNPPAQNIPAITINPTGSVTLSYATVPGYSYHIESTPGLSPSSWTLITGSTTNALTQFVTFTTAIQLSGGQHFFRTVSP